MPKVVKPLSDTQIRQAKAKQKEYNLPDGQGLQLRVKPSGVKVWLFNYSRPLTKKRNNLVLGRYPAITLRSARQLKDKAQSLLARGIDPAEFKAKQEEGLAQKKQHTLQHVCRKWFDVKSHSVTDDYANDIWRSLELHIFPTLSEVSIHELKPALVITTLKPLAEKGSLESVKRVCQRLNEVMTFAVNTGLIEINYLVGIRHAFQSPKATNMPTLQPNELGKLMVDLYNANIRRVTRLLIEWQLHTMVRPSEASGAKWSEVDEDKRLWTIPAERMKKKIAHTVPLTDYTLKLLQEARSLSSNSDFIFPADRKRGEPTNPQTANMALKRMGYSGKLVAHGLRALASTTLNEKGIAPDLIEAALAHTDRDSVRRAYNRTTYIERRREVMTMWSHHIISEYKKAL